MKRLFAALLLLAACGSALANCQPGYVYRCEFYVNTYICGCYRG